MKKVLFFSILSLFFASQGSAFANEAGGLSDQDFTQLTCSYLSETDNKTEALTQVLADTQSVISSEQKQTLEDLMTEEISVKDFCKGIEL